AEVPRVRMDRAARAAALPHAPTVGPGRGGCAAAVGGGAGERCAGAPARVARGGAGNRAGAHGPDGAAADLERGHFWIRRGDFAHGPADAGPGVLGSPDDRTRSAVAIADLFRALVPGSSVRSGGIGGAAGAMASGRADPGDHRPPGDERPDAG